MNKTKEKIKPANKRNKQEPKLYNQHKQTKQNY